MPNWNAAKIDAEIQINVENAGVTKDNEQNMYPLTYYRFSLCYVVKKQTYECLHIVCEEKLTA